MTATAAPPVASPKESWTPMIAIALGQALMSFNVAAIPVAMGGMVESFGVPPTTVGTGIVLYSLSVAGFVMLGAKLCQRFGSVVIFRIVVALFGVAQVLMTFSPVAEVMLVAQLLAGLAAAALVPSLVALIAHHYTGTQQATAVGALGSARAGAGGYGVPARRHPRHLPRLAADFWPADRHVGAGVSAQLSPEARQGPA